MGVSPETRVKGMVKTENPRVLANFGLSCRLASERVKGKFGDSVSGTPGKGNVAPSCLTPFPIVQSLLPWPILGGAYSVPNTF